MATNHTENYKLNLWEPTDRFLREEFNENTEKIDAALGEKQDKITGAQGQVVGFDVDGNPAAQAVQKVNGKALSGDISLSAADVGAVPTTRKVNNKALTGDITLSAADVGASPAGHKHTKSEITDFPTSMPASDVSAWAKAASKPTYTAAEVGARPSTWTPTAADVGALASGGTAAAATKLATARTIRTNLASTSTASFNGTANVAPGVTGTLPIANGGTGATTAAAALTALGAVSTTQLNTALAELQTAISRIETQTLWEKLIDVTLKAQTTRWDINVSGIDFFRYAELRMFVEVPTSCSWLILIHVNGNTTTDAYTNKSPNSTSGGKVGRLVGLSSPNSYLHRITFIHPQRGYKIAVVTEEIVTGRFSHECCCAPINWEELESFNLTGIDGKTVPAGTRVILMGVKK